MKMGNILEREKREDVEISHKGTKTQSNSQNFLY